MKRIKRLFEYFIKGLSEGYIIIIILTLLFVSITTYKALIYRYEIDTYKEYFLVIEQKLSNEVKTGYEKGNIEITKQYQDIQVSEYISCLNSKLTYDQLSTTIKENIQKLQNLYNKSNNHFAFKYIDIYTGFSINYNENQEIYAASTVKGPLAIYLYQQAEKNNINLDDRLEYKKKIL